MRRRVTTGGAIALLGAVVSNACSGTISDDVVVGERPTPAFVAPDAASEAAPSRTLTEYCPSDRCPTGYTTCPSSKFLCDVDIRSDRANCGGCGMACPEKTPYEAYACIDGACVLDCRRPDLFQNCDALIDTGCESSVDTNENCGACGHTCTDLEHAPCQNELGAPECGCRDPYTYCKPTSEGQKVCRKLEEDDQHCNACGNACKRGGPEGAPPPPPNAHYGCVLGECDKLKCDDNWGDCNQDLYKVGSDGCEKHLSVNDACTSCTDDCTAQGMVCGVDVRQGFVPRCLCPAGQTFCVVYDFGLPLGGCADFSSDAFNCGACGRICPGSTDRSRAVCEYGACRLECGAGWADCNGNVDDDCEVNVLGDPHNCGGCGVTCEPGQACAGGRCVVEPCDGVVAR